ncbi:MAG: hypothetical protein D6731_10740 [Planctomycetota bacterium]|nr:MAG: hypothetical protein D6731_10740 [Planctomycetota bacterium]
MARACLSLSFLFVPALLSAQGEGPAAGSPSAPQSEGKREDRAATPRSQGPGGGAGGGGTRGSPAEGTPEGQGGAAPRGLPTEAAARRERLRARLNEAVVHLSFRRARLSEVLVALERACGVPCRLGAKAQRVLRKRKFRLRYVADRRAADAVRDLARAAALDAEVTPEGVVFDLPRELRRLRRSLGLPVAPIRPRAEDVARMLRTKTVRLVARGRPLAEVLAFLRRETGVGIVLAARDVAQTPVTLVRVEAPLGELLDALTRPLGLDWMRQGSAVLVDRAEAIRRHRAPPPTPPGDPPR